MALNECRECTNLVSTEAVACPRCGCPVKSMHAGGTAAAPIKASQGSADTDILPATREEDSAKGRPRRPSRDRWPQETPKVKQGGPWRYAPLVIALVVLGGAGGFGAWVLHSDQVKRQEADARAAKVREEEAIQLAVDINMRQRRLKSLTARLEAHQHGVQMTFGVKRQFGIDSDTGLAQFEAVGFVGPSFVVLADPSTINTTPYAQQQRVLAKIGRNPFEVTHTSNQTGAQSTSTEYQDVYEVVTAAGTAALERQVAELKKQLE